MKLASITAALMMALAVAIAPSSTAAAAAAGRPPVTCVAFHPDETTTSLLMNKCLTAGNAICSANGSWAFGIDPTDQQIKLWEGNRVRFIHISLGFFDSCNFLRQHACINMPYY